MPFDILVYRFIFLISLIACYNVTDCWSSFVSVFNSNNNSNRRRNHQTGALFLSGDASSSSASAAYYTEREMQLVNYLMETFNNNKNSNDRLPCGLSCTDKERQYVSNMINNLLSMSQNDNNNNKANNVKVNDILGEWNLLYTSSRTMIINKSLSGLGRSESDKANVKYIHQKLSGSKYLGFVEYTERIGGSGGRPDNDDDDDETAFDVVISGEWAMESVTDPFTGAPNTAIRLDLDKVVYGPSITNQAETWASLGPIKLLDIVYLTQNLQICRGNINTDSIFVFRRIK